MDEIDQLWHLLQNDTDFVMSWIDNTKGLGWEWTYRCTESQKVFETKAECIHDFVKDLVDEIDWFLSLHNDDEEEDNDFQKAESFSYGNSLFLGNKMGNSEDKQMAVILSVENVSNAYLESSMRKAIRSCEGDKELAYKIMLCLSNFYHLKDDIKKVLADSKLDF